MTPRRPMSIGRAIGLMLVLALWLLCVAISIVSMLFATDHLTIAIGAFSCGLAAMTVFHWWLDHIKERRTATRSSRIVEPTEFGRVEYL